MTLQLIDFTFNPALCALISGLTTLLGVTLLSLIPINVKILILTPAASAETQSITGTKDNKIPKNISATTIIAIINNVPLEIRPLAHTSSKVCLKLSNNNAYSFYLDNLNFCILVNKAAFSNNINSFIIYYSSS